MTPTITKQKRTAAKAAATAERKAVSRVLSPRKQPPIRALQQRRLGTLLGLAVGDALGAPAGFLTTSEIEARFGFDGLTDFAAWGNFRAGSVTKHTQLALATAHGCLRSRLAATGRQLIDDVCYVHQAYERWAALQQDPRHNRAPGSVDLAAINDGVRGTIDEPVNDSNGNGAVYRMAPVGLFYDSSRAFAYGIEFAAITHGNPSGYLPAGFVAETIAHLCEGRSLLKSVERAVQTLTGYGEHEETLQRIQLAREFAAGRVTPVRAIRALGTGWRGDEALAIGLYCALYASLWSEKREPAAVYGTGVLSAVNAAGSGEAASALTGAILGAALGIDAIPAKWIKRVEGSAGMKRLVERM